MRRQDGYATAGIPKRTSKPAWSERALSYRPEAYATTDSFNQRDDSASSVANPAPIPSRYIAQGKVRIVPHFRAVEYQRICSLDY
jgi:hypothetical protein